MIFADYIRLVLADFERKKAAGLLPTELIKPSPGELRDLCYRMCDGTYNRKDEQALEPIFGAAADGKARLKSIEDFKIAQFKPLINFLKDPTIEPKLKTVELLAWMIDFRGRPYNLHSRLPDVERSDAPDAEETLQAGDVGAPEETLYTAAGGGGSSADPMEPKPSNAKKVRIVVTITIVLAATIGSLLVRMRSQAGMFWAGDHFERVSGNRIGTPVFPLDSVRLTHFRKITRPDTITENALGSIWCVRYHGKYECYTDTGHHPIDTSLKLQLLTDYILMRYVNPKIGSIKMAQ